MQFDCNTFILVFINVLVVCLIVIKAKTRPGIEAKLCIYNRSVLLLAGF